MGRMTGPKPARPLNVITKSPGDGFARNGHVMFCPNCGLEHLETRRFCNRCGTNLDLVSRALTGAFSQSSEAEMKRGRRRLLARGFWFFSMGPAFGLSCLILREILGSLGVGGAWTLERVALFGPLIMLLAVLWTIYQLIAFGTEQPVVIQPKMPEVPVHTPSPAIPTAAAHATLRTPLSVTETTTYSLRNRERGNAQPSGERDPADGRASPPTGNSVAKE